MSQRNLESLSRHELIRALAKLETAERRFTANAGAADRERLIHDLHVHQVELEMQNRELREAQESLEEAKSRYSDLYDLAPVGYCTLDLEGRIQELNVTAADLLGAPRPTLIGSSFAATPVLRDKHCFLAHLRRCLSQKGQVISEVSLAIGRHESRAVRIISDPVRGPDGETTAYRTILVDISDLKTLQSRLQVLAAAGERLASSTEYMSAIEAAARVAVPALADICMIDVSCESGAIERKLVLFADPLKQATLAERWLQLVPRPGWQSPQARVAASGEPMLLAEVSVDPPAQPFRDELDSDALRATAIRSLLLVPLAARGRTFGALTLAFAESGRRYSPPDLEMAQDLSRRIAMALDNARLYEAARQTNQALCLAEAKASGIVAVSADAIISIDQDHKITLFNEGAEQIFGYSKTKALGAPFEVLIPQRFRAGHRQHVERFAAGEKSSRRMGDRSQEIFGLRSSGEEFPADGAISKLTVGGEMILTVALRDMTEERRIARDQKVLAEMGSLLAATLDYEETLTRIAQLAVRDLADFCIVDLVEQDGDLRRLRVVGQDPSKTGICDALKRVPIDRERPSLAWSAYQKKQTILLADATPDALAAFAQSEEHLRVLLEMSPRSIIVAPLLARGNALGVIEFVSSTPQRVYRQADLRLVEEIASRAALAIESARLYRLAERAIQARNDVLSVVAHDLRNPLGAILLQAALLRVLPADAERCARTADAVERTVNHMNRLIQDLLDITRIDAGRLSIEHSLVDAGMALSGFAETQEPLAAAASVALRLDLAPGRIEVFADRDRLLQVLENLVTNAIRFSRPGGEITVGAAPGQGEVLFWVEDTGAGIAAGELPHIFDRFWQGRKAARQGAGLGLPIAKGIIDAHGGRIWVESQLGVGTTFFFTLPLPDPERRAAGTVGPVGALGTVTVSEQAGVVRRSAGHAAGEEDGATLPIV